MEFKDAQATKESIRWATRGDLDNPYFDDVIHGTPKQYEDAYRLGMKLGKVNKCLIKNAINN